MVRMLAGLHAGEVVRLPFLAARGAIKNGMARAIVDVMEPIVIATEQPAVSIAPSRTEHHKRPGRRR